MIRCRPLGRLLLLAGLGVAGPALPPASAQPDRAPAAAPAAAPTGPAAAPATAPATAPPPGSTAAARAPARRAPPPRRQAANRAAPARPAPEGGRATARATPGAAPAIAPPPARPAEPALTRPPAEPAPPPPPILAAPPPAAPPAEAPLLLPASLAARAEGGWRLRFAAEADTIPESAAATLIELGRRLAAGPAGRITLIAQASGPVTDASLARRLSLARGLAVKQSLVAGGLPNIRVDIRPMGRLDEALDVVDIQPPEPPRADRQQAGR